MRKALIGILLAATTATPLWAAPGERAGRVARQDGDDSARPARVERQQARQEQRVERQEQRVERQVVRQEQRVERQQQPAPPVVTQQGWRNRGGDGQTQQGWRGRGGNDGQTQQSWRNRGGDGQTQQGWRGRSDRGGSGGLSQSEIEAAREASRNSAAGGSPELQRQAARNQAAWERRQREQGRDGRRDWDRDRRDGRRDWDRDGRGWDRDGRDGRRDWDRDGRRRWDRNWRHDHRYDWQRWRYSNRNIFSRGRYYAPYRNHRYSRLSIGLILGSAFWGQNYWLNDPWQYRLPPAYPGTRWVRYYDDVLLIDVYSGEVIDVIYDFFW